MIYLKVIVSCGMTESVRQLNHFRFKIVAKEGFSLRQTDFYNDQIMFVLLHL